MPSAQNPVAASFLGKKHPEIFKFTSTNNNIFKACTLHGYSIIQTFSMFIHLFPGTSLASSYL
jgi:hypothetical protein